MDRGGNDATRGFRSGWRAIKNKRIQKRCFLALKHHCFRRCGYKRCLYAFCSAPFPAFRRRPYRGDKRCVTCAAACASLKVVLSNRIDSYTLFLLSVPQKHRESVYLRPVPFLQRSLGRCCADCCPASDCGSGVFLFFCGSCYSFYFGRCSTCRFGGDLSKRYCRGQPHQRYRNRASNKGRVRGSVRLPLR